MREIILKCEDKVKRVLFDDYVRAKFKSLKEFGYRDLTIDEVEAQAIKVLDGQTEIGKDKLTVIGVMMVGEITKEATK